MGVDTADDRLPFYQDKLHEPVLYARFQEILQKVYAHLV